MTKRAAKTILLSALAVLFLHCETKTVKNNINQEKAFAANHSLPNKVLYDSSITILHVFVALCDNKYQGIVPVPKRIGNGQDVEDNLYWGCSAGVRTYFRKSSKWIYVKKYAVDSLRLERVVFKHKAKNCYLVADAYNGKFIKKCTVDFLKSCAGLLSDTLSLDGITLGIYGNAKLLSYIGHDGLMDFSLTNQFQNADRKTRDAIILACMSKKYFSPFVLSAKANPLVWTTGLMCPEAYTLHDALESYLGGEQAEGIRTNAAQAYAKYQRCGIKAAKNLLVSGF